MAKALTKIRRTPFICKKCDGTGKWHTVAVVDLHGKLQPSEQMPCVSCSGSGMLIREVEYPVKNSERMRMKARAA